MRLLLYKFFTQLIVVLGVLRQKVGCRKVVRGDRTFFNEMSDIRLPAWGVINECCDCGLSHRIWLGRGLYQRPLRPKKYNYDWRWLAGAPTGFLEGEAV